jgi:hypothetical protein
MWQQYTIFCPKTSFVALASFFPLARIQNFAKNKKKTLDIDKIQVKPETKPVGVHSSIHPSIHPFATAS